jgi:O-antigen/teichoic acid export membrane protein
LTPLFYAGSSVATASAQLLAGFLVIKWITPEELGLWQSVRIAQVYAFILLAGVNNGLGRELPFFLGKGNDSFAQRLAATALFCATLANGVVLLCGIGCAIAFARKGTHLVCAILAVTILIILAFYQQIFTVTFRSKDSFKTLTKIQFAEAGLALVTVPLVYYFRYNGMLARTVVMSGIVGLLLFVFRPMQVKMRMDWQALKLLLKTGLPIFGLDYMKNSCGTLDRVVLLRIGGVRDVGMYALAGVALQTLGTLPSSLASYIYPRMTYKYGQNGDTRALWKFGFRFVLLAVAFAGLAAACAWLILPYFVTVFVPKYLAGLRAAQIVLVAGIFEGATIIVNALWSMKAWKLMVTYQVVSSVLFALGPVLGVIIIGRSLEGVAWGATIGAAGRGVLALGLTFYGTRRTAR